MNELKKNMAIEGEVTGLTHEGQGVVKVDGYPLFVDNALPGERVEVRITKLGKHFGFGRNLRIIESSDDRETGLNIDYLRTGIADLGHLKYPAQLTFKRLQVSENLRKVAGKANFPVMKTLGADEPLHYRNKASVPVRRVGGLLETGFFRKHSHQLVPIEDFYIQEPRIDELIAYVRDAMRDFGLSAFDEESRRGLVRNLVVRRGHYSGELMLIIVDMNDKLPEAMIEQIKTAFPDLESIYLNINKSTGNAILSQDFKLLAGKKTITDSMLDKSFEIGPASFYQVNTAQAEKLYQTAYDFAELKESDTIIDAYSGIGTVGLAIADRVKAVYGMEVVEDAVFNAKNNAKLNNIENAHYELGKAEEVMPKWLEAGIKPDVIFVDPPRKGLDESFIEASSQTQARNIVYISCNPSTFARDVKRFEERGYELEKLRPVDLFPQTHHVECVGLLRKK
ncbi:23S rRNA (uracil(1939)-C(5))-methyltransferase RlmD [Lactococcus termiticola]|nr:23S rRNA (uracil(1939)-C(5))-methyltransferase RlmD [Lactococcus termiticola]